MLHALLLPLLTACGAQELLGHTPPAPLPEPDGRGLMLTSREADQLKLLPVKLIEGGAQLLRPLETHAAPQAPSHFDGERGCVLLPASTAGGPVRLGFAILGQEDFLSVDLPAEIEYHSVFTQGTRCWAGGTDAAVVLADFAAAKPVARRLSVSGFEGASPRKAVDFFVDTGSRIVAVDDIMRPFYAFSFAPEVAVGARDAGLTITLPPGVNASYLRGLSAGGQVLLWRYSGTLRGAEQRLMAFDTAAFDVAGEPEVRASVREFAPRRQEAATVLAGERFTNWTDMAHLDGRVYLSAGERGLLAFELPLDTLRSKAEHHPLEGASCVALTAHDGALYAVIEREGKRALARLSLDPTSQKLGATELVELPNTVSGFAQ